MDYLIEKCDDVSITATCKSYVANCENCHNWVDYVLRSEPGFGLRFGFTMPRYVGCGVGNWDIELPKMSSLFCRNLVMRTLWKLTHVEGMGPMETPKLFWLRMFRSSRVLYIWRSYPFCSAIEVWLWPGSCLGGNKLRVSLVITHLPRLR
jgi:hypothetical protein